MNLYELKNTTNWTHQGQRHCTTARPSPPGWHVHFTRHSPVRGSLVCQPVHCGKRFSISLLVSTSLCDTHCEIVPHDVFNPSNHCLVNIGWVWEVHVIDRNLYLNRFVRIKDVRFQWNLFANCFSPDWVVTEAMTAFLGRESCKQKQHICNTVWLKNGQHVWVQNNGGGKPQTNTNSNPILWKKVKGIKSLPCWSFCFDCLFVSAFVNKIYTWIEFTTSR